MTLTMADMGRGRVRSFREDELHGTTVLEKGIKFKDLALFKKALELHSIQSGYDYRCRKSDKLRVTTACKLLCGW